jgi:RimJ/RimL family protein N-acetyltransferase
MHQDIRTQFFPMKLHGGVTAQAMDRESALKWIMQFNHRIFPPGFKEQTGAYRPPKDRAERVAGLWKQHIDTHPEWVILFEEGNAPIGWFYGYMADEETFFIDTIGIVPEFRNKGIYQAFLRQLIAYLKAAGYERLTSTHHPNNRAVIIAELKVGFNIVGLELYEGAGTILKVAHMLREDRQRAFEWGFHMVPEAFWNSTASNTAPPEE